LAKVVLKPTGYAVIALVLSGNIDRFSDIAENAKCRPSYRDKPAPVTVLADKLTKAILI
jgi:hypothetical protein